MQILVMLSVALLLLFLPASTADQNKAAFIVSQHSDETACAEEDNVMLKILPARSTVKGLNILPQKPVFKTKELVASIEPDYSGCLWAQQNYEETYYYPKCSGGYLDKDKVCSPEIREKIFENTQWSIITDQGVRWQPFMDIVNSQGQSIGVYKSVYIQRLSPVTVSDPHPTVVVIYSDGYLRPTYFSEIGEPSGWGGSFILGDSTFIQHATPRFYNNIQQMRIRSDGNDQLHLELVFAKNPDYPAQVVIYYDYDQKGLVFFAPNNSKELLTFVSMYRNKTVFDIEYLVKQGTGSEQFFNVMEPHLDKMPLYKRFLLTRHNPSTHNTLAPNFQITALEISE